MLVNALIGVHDQFSAQGATFLYSHYDSEGDGQSPLFNSLAGSGVLGGFIWFLIKKQLRKYMEFHLRTLPACIQPGKDYAVSSLFRGRTRVGLENVTLRVVASNLEQDQYTRGSGSSRRTVSFKEPVRGVVLYEKRVSHIPRKVPIHTYFNERFSFDPMFKVLYAPFMVSNSHGLGIHWEIQLLHPEFVNQEFAASTAPFAYEDFLQS